MPSRVEALAGASGKRRASPHRPVSFKAAFRGMGLDSTKSWPMKGNSSLLSRTASWRRPSRAASTSALKRRGRTFAATLTSPSAPTARDGNARPSSPDKTVLPAGSVLQISLICPRLPEDSFTATRFSILMSRLSTAGVRLRPVLPGTL